MNRNKYFLPDNYVENPPSTYSTQPKEYWTVDRIKLSHDYQYHVYDYAGKLFRKMGYKSLLDIGAGPGTKIPIFFNVKGIEVCLIDQPGMDEVIHQVLPDCAFFGANLEKSPISTGKRYDMVVCSDVIEHLVDPLPLLELIRKHLNPKGIAILSTPDRDMRRGKGNLRSPNTAHVREWNGLEFKSFLMSEGYCILEHKNLPLKKLSNLIYKLSQTFLYKKFKKSDWFACQMLVVKT